MSLLKNTFVITQTVTKNTTNAPLIIPTASRLLGFYVNAGTAPSAGTVDFALSKNGVATGKKVTLAVSGTSASLLPTLGTAAVKTLIAADYKTVQGNTVAASAFTVTVSGNASNTAVTLPADTRLQVGLVVSGTNVVAGTTLVSVVGTTGVLSTATTGTVTSMTFTPPFVDNTGTETLIAGPLGWYDNTTGGKDLGVNYVGATFPADTIILDAATGDVFTIVAGTDTSIANITATLLWEKI